MISIKRLGIQLSRAPLSQEAIKLKEAKPQTKSSLLPLFYSSNHPKLKAKTQVVVPINEV
jgi:hypothetical protein